MSIKHPTFRGQVYDQEAAVYSQPFALREKTAFNLSALVKELACIYSTRLH